MTFIGQFIDHDLTLDATSPLGQPTAPESTINRRTPAFDLDSVYGSGPFGDPLLYEADRMRLKVGTRGAFEDVPRLADGTRADRRLAQRRERRRQRPARRVHRRSTTSS